MTLEMMVHAVDWVLLAYLAAINLGYLALSITSFVVMGRHLRRYRALDALPQAYSEFEPPVSIIVPAYNEEAIVVTTVRSLLQLHYGSFEIIVVNDGSTDTTLQRLKDAFDLRPFPEAMRSGLETKRVLATYRSPNHPNLKVIDKENGKKGDTLNAGINSARYPLFCALDADSVLQPDSLRRIVRPFLEDPHTVASGGVIRIANGCGVTSGWLAKTGVPQSLLGRLQVVEYCRAFLFGRLAWSPANALLVISGAFGLFHKETVVAIGGYRTDTIGEDMELVVRMHRILRQAKVPYRISFVPDPVCWTEAPEDLRTLKAQRVRWQIGLSESLRLNAGLMCSRNGGLVGWVAFPFALLFEWASPFLEWLGYLFFTVGFLAGFVEIEFALAFVIVAVGFGTLLSVTALLLDELSYRTFPDMKHLTLLLIAALLENCGYRQLNTWWRLEGLIRGVVGKTQGWGRMKRTALWNAEPSTGGTASVNARNLQVLDE